MNHRYNISPYTDLPTVPKTTMMIGSFYPQSLRASVQVVWLRQPDLINHRHNHLLDQFASAGMDISICSSSEIHADRLLESDLILLESYGRINYRTNRALGRIRDRSRAPLVLLTDDQPVEWHINAIRAGADAILPLSTSNDIIIARCNALLRRWLPRS